MLIIIR